MPPPRTRTLSGPMGNLPARLKLSAWLDGKRVSSALFETGALSVGSAPDNGLQIASDTVSRKHLEVSRLGGALLVKDLESRNGTRFQGSRIREAYVPLGAVLVLGEAELRVEDADETARSQLGGLVSQSPAMMGVIETLKRVAPTDSTVLLEAETGSGKEVTARALHGASARAKGPFETVDCGALPRELAASELFGHVKGAFTGADRARAGAFERAHGGTLFLDEIGELPLDLQPLLLRALENRQIRRVGDQAFRDVDVRVVAATNRDLEQEVTAGRFRADLLHRLSVVRLRLPPLRERLEDLPLLVRAILDQLGPRARGFCLSDEAFATLEAHTWPGNVRELKNLVERAAALGDVSVLAPEGTPAAPPTLDYRQAREDALGAFEKDFVVYLLRSSDKNVSKAARTAGIDRVYLHKLIKKHGLDVASL